MAFHVCSDGGVAATDADENWHSCELVNLSKFDRQRKINNQYFCVRLSHG